MPERAAIVTGASSGIGLAVARLLGEQGWGVTMAARRPEKLQAAHDELKGRGFDVQQVSGNLGLEQDIKRVVDAHRDAYGRCDLLMNNAGVGVGEPIGELTTKMVDIQIATNLRSIPLFYREALDMLKAAGAEHRNALVVNTSSISGKRGEAWLSVYSATKHGVVGFTQAMNKELGNDGIKSCALCPGFVDTPMTDFVKGIVPADQMITTRDIAEAVRFLLTLSPGCVVPEIMFERPGGELLQSAD
ncbi:MAG TPA: SDR family oxidoreductase [Solirubrobacteraceae bacterium]|jgi:NAD(P)-dependent dehydrogenase (short-subunit alcohol dehydrogenase family)|nr:SDR family oxidoreductase [Solirubrobacteraceae bacterium]